MINSLIKSSVMMAALVLMVACANVSYESSMPKQSRVLDKIPQSFLGSYIAEGDSTASLVITEKGFTTPDFSATIGENLEVKPYMDYLVVNTFQEGYWLVYLADRNNDQTIEVLAVDAADDETLKSLQEITKVEILYNEDGGVDRAHINPSDQEFRKIIDQGLFESIGVFTPVRE